MRPPTLPTIVKMGKNVVRVIQHAGKLRKLFYDFGSI